MPNLNSACQELYKLMSSRNAQIWTPLHKIEFQSVKEAIKEHIILNAFDRKNIQVKTDGSQTRAGIPHPSKE